MISYRELLEVFWYSHSPTAAPWSTQYKSAIFYHNDEQRRLAVETRDSLEATLNRKVYTDIVPATKFYPAEGYHQKYYLQNEPELLREFRAIYPDINDFVSSTAVARVNGYAGGYGNSEDLEEELGSLGLSEAGKDIVREIAVQGLMPGCPVPGVRN